MSYSLKPPQPKKIPKVHTAHGDERIDDYYWLRDDTRKDPEVISYLDCLLYTSPSPRDVEESRMPSSA